jgi:hypothetical protein
MNTKHIFQTVILIGCALFFDSSQICAQQVQSPLNYWRNPEGMLQEHAALLFEQAHVILEKYPPLATVGEERKLALLSIDALLHDVRLDHTKAFTDYVEKRFQHVVKKLENETLNKNEIRIHQLYNHGYIIKTPSVTFGFDVIRGGRPQSPFVSDAVIRSLISQCDILFISHEHGDHADKTVAQMFCDQNKNVIIPPGLWENMSPKIKHLRGEGIITEKIDIPAKNTALTVKVFPGHQDAVLNNVYAVTSSEGITVMHTGDQYHTGDMQWISRVSEEVEVDVFLVHCWMPAIEKTIDGIKPKFIIVGHENEMEHTIDHRESYWLAFRCFANVKVPYIVMAWGESFTFSR